MDDKKFSNAQYDKIAEDYVRIQREFFADQKDWTRDLLHAELKMLKGKRTLDIGCGSGDDVKWCEEKGIEAYGIDPSEKMVAIAQANIKNHENIKIGDYENIPFPNEYFDFLMGRYSIHYLRSLTKAYQEMARVLRKNGVLVLVASHPIYDNLTLLDSDDKEYVSAKLYDGKVELKFPPHKVSDYFSSVFLGLFDLKAVNESESVDAVNPKSVPETLFYKAEKR